jgi:hypothetical protein
VTAVTFYSIPRRCINPPQFRRRAAHNLNGRRAARFIGDSPA